MANLQRRTVTEEPTWNGKQKENVILLFSDPEFLSCIGTKCCFQVKHLSTRRKHSQSLIKNAKNPDISINDVYFQNVQLLSKFFY